MHWWFDDLDTGQQWYLIVIVLTFTLMVTGALLSWCCKQYKKRNQVVTGTVANLFNGPVIRTSDSSSSSSDDDDNEGSSKKKKKRKKKKKQQREERRKRRQERHDPGVEPTAPVTPGHAKHLEAEAQAAINVDSPYAAPPSFAPLDTGLVSLQQPQQPQQQPPRYSTVYTQSAPAAVLYPRLASDVPGTPETPVLKQESGGGGVDNAAFVVETA